MSFAAMLQEIVDGCSGAIGAALMSSDGVPIEEVVAPEAWEGGHGEEIGNAGVEFGRILDEIRKASDAMSAGAVHETVISLARFTLILGDDELAQGVWSVRDMARSTQESLSEAALLTHLKEKIDG